MFKVCLRFTACLTAILVWGVLCIVAARPAFAAEPPTLIVVFDGSGSMWGRIEGQRDSKLAMARDGIAHGLARLAPTTRVGLMSFGHRRGGDCQDTEVIVEPVPLDVSRIMSPLERLNPKGRGPLTKALREAIPILGPASAPARILLVHDGADNCQEDPCSVLGPLRAAHPRARVDVVSLGVRPDEARTLACLPQGTGGKQYVVSTAAEIDAARIEALGAAPQPASASAAASADAADSAKGTVATESKTTDQPGRPGLQLWATLVKGGQPLAAPITWRVRRAGEKGPPLWEGQTASPLLVLPTGRYDVEASIGLITRTAVAEAVEGAPRAVSLSLDAGMLALAQAKSTKAMLDSAVVTLSRIEGTSADKPTILHRTDADLVLPAGNYLVSVTSGALRIERPVGIIVGERVSIANALALGAVELDAVAVKGEPSLDGLVYAVYEDDPDAPQGRREVARSAAAKPRFKLPAGTYYVIARRGPIEARDRVSVRSGETEKHTMVLEVGRVEIVVRLPGGQIENEDPITHRLERIDVQPPELLTANGISATLEASSGRYRLRSRIGLGNVRAEREFDLKSGEVERLVVEHNAGGARFRMVEKIGGPPLPDTSFEVRDGSGRSVWSGLGTEPRVLLMAGRYTVRAEGRGTTLQRTFEIGAGEDRIVQLAPR
jgi:Ca-activated chloride channel family protein